MLVNKIQDPGVPMFLFSLEGNVMDQRREMVDSLEDLRASLPIKGEDFPDSENARRENCFLV